MRDARARALDQARRRAARARDRARWPQGARRLETRSTLHHDFTHLALEEAAGIDDGFFGSLARGATLAELMGKDGGEPRYTGRMLEVERAVAVLQSLAKTDADPAELHAHITRSLAVQGESPPSWLTLELVAAVRERQRRLVGQWKVTPYDTGLEITWTEAADRP